MVAANGGAPSPVASVTILVNPLNGALNIDHRGIPRLGVIEILGECLKTLARAIHKEATDAAATKVEVAGAHQLRALPKIEGA